jgi:hypothetical protein
MILRGDQQQESYGELGRERQLQRPQEAGDDQQPGQAENEMKNRISPSEEVVRSAAGTEQRGKPEKETARDRYVAG